MSETTNRLLHPEAMQLTEGVGKRGGDLVIRVPNRQIRIIPENICEISLLSPTRLYSGGLNGQTFGPPRLKIVERVHRAGKILHYYFEEPEWQEVFRSLWALDVIKDLGDLSAWLDDAAHMMDGYEKLVEQDIRAAQEKARQETEGSKQAAT